MLCEIIFIINLKNISLRKYESNAKNYKMYFARIINSDHREKNKT